MRKMRPEHFPGAIPEARPWPGRGAVKGVSPGGAGLPILHVYRRYEDGVWTCERPAPEGCVSTLDGGVPAQAYTLGRDGSGLRAPSSSRHQVSPSHARAWRGEEGEERGEVIGVGFSEEVRRKLFRRMRRISEAVEGAWGEVPQGISFWSRYARRLGAILGAEVEPAPPWEVPREVLHEVKQLIGWEDSDLALRLWVRALRIRFADWPALVFWLVFDYQEGGLPPNFSLVVIHEAPSSLSSGSSGRRD